MRQGRSPRRCLRVLAVQETALLLDLWNSRVRGVGVGDYGCWTEAAALTVGEKWQAGMHENRRGRRVRVTLRATALAASLVTAVVVVMGSGGTGLAVASSSR